MSYFLSRLRSRVISALIVLSFIWLFLARFADYDYTSLGFGDAKEGWDETLAAEAAEDLVRIAEEWQKDKDVDSACQQLLAPVSDAKEQHRVTRIAELERALEKEKAEKDGLKVWDKSTVLNGPPMDHFRDNLKNDTYYITSWAAAGFTNQYMGYVNMIYLATLTDRIPIMPPFAPDHHINPEAGVVPFGDVFDLEHLSAQLRIPVLEWRDLKKLPTREDPNPYPFQPRSMEHPSEALGCWSTRRPSEPNPIRAPNTVYHLGLDVAYHRVPSFTRYQAQNPHDEHVVFSSLAALIYKSSTFSSTQKSDIAPSWGNFADPEREPDRYEDIGVSPGGHHNPPEAQLSCFDSMYYVTSGAEFYEWRFGFSPVWRTVGKWLRFSKKMEDMVQEYLNVLFGRAREDDMKETPPFIAVHIRRGDFQAKCGQENPNCLPSITVYKNLVEEVRAELLEKKGVNVHDVVVMSDESSPDFWAEAKSLGWLSVDHQAHRTLERFGEWFPPLIDIVIQSYAIGFVGTEESTFSMVSQKRVIDWNGGVVRSV